MEKKNKVLISGGCAAAILLSAYFHFSAENLREQADLIAKENEMTENFTETVAESAFLYPTIEDLSNAASQMASRGITVSEIRETAPEAREHGDILRLEIIGTATFNGLLDMFDIIHEKDKWMTLEFRRIVREGDHLRFEADLTAYRARGTE